MLDQGIEAPAQIGYLSGRASLIMHRNMRDASSRALASLHDRFKRRVIA